jgi:cysteine-rich repeat protein
MSARARVAAVVLLAPVVLGAHCKEECGPPAVRLVGARNLERTFYGAGVLLLRPRAAPLANALAPFERRELRVDVSRPAAVVLVEPGALRVLGRVDASRLKPGDRGEGYRVLAVVEQVGRVSLFEDPGLLTEARRERYDALLLVPRSPGARPWEASVAIELGRRIERHNDEQTGKCVDKEGAPPAVPELGLYPLPARCGDGVRQDDEDCDDGNHTAGDGCSPYCLRER